MWKYAVYCLYGARVARGNAGVLPAGGCSSPLCQHAMDTVHGFNAHWKRASCLYVSSLTLFRLLWIGPPLSLSHSFFLGGRTHSHARAHTRTTASAHTHTHAHTLSLKDRRSLYLLLFTPPPRRPPPPLCCFTLLQTSNVRRLSVHGLGRDSYGVCLLK